MKVKKSLVFVVALTGLMQAAMSFAVGPDGRPDGRPAGGGRVVVGGGGDRVVVSGPGIPFSGGGRVVVGGPGIPVAPGGRTVVVTHHDASGYRPPVVDVRHDGGFDRRGGFDPRYPGYPIYPGGPVVVPPYAGGGWGDRPGFDHHRPGDGRWVRPFEYDHSCVHNYDFGSWERSGYAITTMTCVAVANDRSGRRFPYTDVRDGFRDRMFDVQAEALDQCYRATGYTYRDACVIESCTPGYEEIRRY